MTDPTLADGELDVSIGDGSPLTLRDIRNLVAWHDGPVSEKHLEVAAEWLSGMYLDRAMQLLLTEGKAKWKVIKGEFSLKAV